MATNSEQPMNGGDGACSHTRDSTLRCGGAQSCKVLISEAIAELFDVNAFVTSSNSINIADLGCSVGPNTFIAMKSIVEAIKLKYQSQNVKGEDIQFQVFFNDHVSNDFNKLFKFLPYDRQYLAAGVPGSFHQKLFLKDSLHFVNSSYSLQWLSRIPNELVDKQSPAWNKGRIWYTGASKEVMNAYSAQFARDMDMFFNARAEELVSGGLMALILPCLHVQVTPDVSSSNGIVDILGESLMDMVKMDLVSEDKVDSFNFPKYNPTPQELEDLINSNGRFQIVKMESVGRPKMIDQVPSVQVFMFRLRAAWEGLIKEHFGGEIIDELFVQFTKKVADSGTLSESTLKSVMECIVLLQRKAT